MAASMLVVLLFIGSGAAALIYEVVWQQLLQLVIGSSTVSLGVLLGTYMGGMCLGSLFGPRFLARRQHPNHNPDEQPPRALPPTPECERRIPNLAIRHHRADEQDRDRNEEQQQPSRKRIGVRPRRR